MRQEMWEVADTDESPLSHIVDEYYMQHELQEFYDEVTDLDAYADERTDLREVPTYAIDPAGAEDRDDAFAVEREYDDGELEGYTAWVHVADVPHYVEAESVIDDYAAQQGFTIYEVDDAKHMLPEDIVQEAGFAERQDRLANTMELSFDDDGMLQDYDIYPSIVSTDRAMSYDDADYYVKQSKNAPWAGQETGELIRSLEDASFLTGKLARDSDRSTGSRSTAHRIVEEFMIKANEIGANELLAAGKGLYRIHADSFDREHEGTAHYSPECHEHNGLGLNQYAHFTSPIRRYPDLVNWRILYDETDKTEQDLQDLATHLNTQETLIENREMDALIESEIEADQLS